MNLIDLFVAYGPQMIQIALIGVFAFQCWQRNPLHMAISGGAMVATFVLGW